MSVEYEEIFDLVVCIQRVKDFDENLELMNESKFTNDSSIFTKNGYYDAVTDGGMVGVNIGIYAPIVIIYSRDIKILSLVINMFWTGWDTFIHKSKDSYQTLI